MNVYEIRIWISPLSRETHHFLAQDIKRAMIKVEKYIQKTLNGHGGEYAPELLSISLLAEDVK